MHRSFRYSRPATDTTRTLTSSWRVSTAQSRTQIRNCSHSCAASSPVGRQLVSLGLPDQRRRPEPRDRAELYYGLANTVSQAQSVPFDNFSADFFGLIGVAANTPWNEAVTSLQSAGDAMLYAIIFHGCGSFEVSWLRCENVGFAVFGVVDTLVFAAEVVVPVGVEVAAGDEGAEPEDGLGAFQPPSRARYVHSILDDVPARAFDDPGGDGPAFLQRPGVVQVVLLVVQVAGAFAGAGSLGGRVAVGGGAGTGPGRDLAGLAVQDLAGLVSDPFLGCRLSLVVEGPGGLPQVFEHVDEVDDDRDGDAAAGGPGGDGLDLRVVAVDQDEPFALVTGVAAICLA